MTWKIVRGDACSFSQTHGSHRSFRLSYPHENILCLSIRCFSWPNANQATIFIALKAIIKTGIIIRKCKTIK